MDTLNAAPIESEKNLLCVGDLIALRLPKPHEGWLSGSCVQGEECFVSRSLDNFNDCLWEVYVQYQYSATREYEEALLRGISNLDLESNDDNVDKKKTASQPGGNATGANRKLSAQPKVKTKRATSVINVFRKGTAQKNEFLNGSENEEIVHENSSILSQLYRAAVTEQKLNESMMSLKYGKPILFGDSIQLRHMKSKQFLTVSKHELAKQERENMKVTLIDTGNILSGLVFSSRFKSDKDGVPIYEDSEILLGVHDRPGEFIHVAKRHIESKREEVNCSLESTVFQLVLYNKGRTAIDNIGKIITAGQLVTLIEPDTMSCLAIDNSDKDDIKVALGSFNAAESTIEESVGTNKLWLIEKDPVILGGTIKIGQDKITFRDLNTGYFLKLYDEEDDSILGVTETRDEATRFNVSNTNQNKSAIVYEDMSIELSANDRFIAHRTDEETGTLLKECCGIENHENGVLSFCISANLMKTVGVGLYVGVENTATLRKFETLARSIHLNNNDQLKQLSSQLKSFFEALNTISSFLVGQADKSKLPKDWDLITVADLNDKVTLRQTMLREQGLLDVLVDLIELCDQGIFDELKAVNFHRRSSAAIIELKKGKDVSILSRSRKSLLQSISERPAIINTRSVTMSSNNNTTGAAKQKKFKYLSPAQILANSASINNDDSSDSSSESDNSDSGTVDRMMNTDNKVKPRPGPSILAKANSISNMVSRTAAGPRLSIGNLFKSAAVAVVADNRLRKATEVKNLVDNRASVTQDLSKQCLRLLHAMILSNHRNQIHIANRLPVILRMIKKSEIAISCITEMFRDNLQILQEILSQREIDILLELLRSSEMNYTVLKLLQSICSCPKGVDGTQRMVAIALYQNTSSKSEVIEMYAEYSRLLPYNWNFGSCYYPKGIDKDKEILGYKILKKGLPRILMSWGDGEKSNPYSTYSLYDLNGRLPLEVLCSREMNNGNTKRKSIRGRLSVQVAQNKTGTAAESQLEDLNIRRQQVIDYLITQLYTVGDMCLDRNYISIEILESIFHYDKLLAILLNPQVTNAIKAPICRILRCMYVDREPQVVTKLPRLIRSSTEERDSFSTSIASGNTSSMYTFCLLQDVISKYLNTRLNGTEFDEYSAELTDLLQNLIAFGFYQTYDQLKDIMIPLITALDDHRNGVWHKHISADSSNMDSKNSEQLGFISRYIFNLVSILNRLFTCIASCCTKIFMIFVAYFGKLKLLSGDDPNNNAIRKHNKWHSYNFSKFDNGKGDAKSTKAEVFWEKRFLHLYNNTVMGMFFVLSIVLVDIILAVTSLFILEDFFVNVDLAFSIYFIVELSLRLYCNKRVEGSISSFFRQIFNCVDAGLVLIDWVLYFVLDSQLGNAVQAAKGLRALRLLRLFRLMRAGRLVRKIVKESIMVTWTAPTKYDSISDEESESIVNILKVLSMIYARIQEKRLGILIKSFVKWCDDNMNESNDISSAIKYYFKVVTSETDLLDDVAPNFNELLLDIMMYSDPNLLQEALELLMVHNCNTLLLVKTAKNVQIIYSTKTEAKLKEISQLLRTLRTMTEKYEIWGTKDDSEKDYETMYGIIDTIISLSTKQNEEPSLSIRNEILVDEEVQMLLKNLDAMACYMLVNQTLFYQTETLSLPVIRILQHCNKLVCWFVEGSNENQQIAFRHIDWFIDRIDDGILSSTVIRSILRGNLQLIKDCPKRYIGQLAEKILSNGHIPDYLDMLLGLTEMSNRKDSSLAVVRNTISRFLTSREWKANVLLWCSAYESPGYYARKEAMAVFADDLVMAQNEMPHQLLYHANLLNLLVYCNLGPKLQAVLYFNDVIRSLLDDKVIFPVRCALGNILSDMILNGISGIDSSAYMWDFVERLTQELEKYLYNKKKHLSSSVKSRIQLGSWLETILTILRTFFQVLDLSCLGDISDLPDGSNFKITERSYISIQALMKRLYSSLRNIIDEYGDNLGKPLLIIAKSAIENICYHSDDIEFDIEEIQDADDNEEPTNRFHINTQRASMTFADFQQTYYRTRFHMLNEELAKVLQASDASPELFARIPSVGHNVTYDVRLEPLLKKLTTHIRSGFKRVGAVRRVETASNIATTTWFVKSLRELLIITANSKSKFKFNFRIFPNQSSKENLNEVDELCAIFNEFGVIFLCIDLLANGITQSLRLEAVKLLISLLEIDSVSNRTKETIYNYLHGSETSFLFYEYLEDSIEQLITWTEREHEILIQSGGRYGKNDHDEQLEIQLPEDIIIFDFLQLSCANNFMPMKDSMREQPNKTKQVNVLKALSKYFSCLSRLEDLPSLKLTSHVMKTLIRLLQGPCKGNQEYLIMRTELLPSFNRFARLIRPQAESLYDEERKLYTRLLQQCISDLANALIEEVPPTTPIYERVCTSLELNMLNVAVLGSSDSNSKEVDLLELDLSKLADIDKNVTYTNAQASYLKFLKTLGFGQMKFSSFVQKKFEDDIQSVEVVMNDKVHSVYFNIPVVAYELHGSNLKKYMADLDVSSQEIKLQKFLALIRLLYKEAIHQTKLNRVGLSFLLGLKSQLTWLMFGISIILNALILIYYGTTTADNQHHTEQRRYLAGSTDDHSGPGISTSLNDELYIDLEIEQVISGLNLLQILLAITTVIIIIITAVPIHFQYHSEQGKNIIVSLFQTAIQTTFLWYCMYLVICILAYFYNQFILSGLLLDFVSIDSTIRDVLLAVQYPARQLGSTLVIILIIVNIFSGVVFSLYRHDVIGFNLYDMWQAFKLTISYGIRGEYGVSYEMNNTLGDRLILDILFYFIVLAILRHIFFAIIVDTFGKLRELKYEREDHRNNSCFICGVDRHEFDQLNSHGPLQGFSYHRSVVHNVNNYIYFVILIWEQKRENDSGIEKHVRECVANGDISWLPIGVNGDGVFDNKELLPASQEHNQKLREHNQTHKPAEKPGQNKSHKSNSGGGDADDDTRDDKRDDIGKKLAAIQSHLSKLVDKDSKTDSSAASLANDQAALTNQAALTMIRDRMPSSAGDFQVDGRGRRTFYVSTENTSPIASFAPKLEQQQQKSPAHDSDMEVMLQSVKKITETLETLTGRLDSLDSKLANVSSATPSIQKRQRFNSSHSDRDDYDDDYQDSSSKKTFIPSPHRQSVARPWSESFKKNRSGNDSDSDVEGIRSKMNSITGPRKEMLKDLLDIS